MSRRSRFKRMREKKKRRSAPPAAGIARSPKLMRQGTVPEEPRARDVLARLKSVRELRADVAPETWQDGLRVVADSVRNHSTLRPGDVGHLTFVSSFVP